jgi:thymidylate synthase
MMQQLDIQDQYKELLRKILNEGTKVKNRTNVDSISIFVANLRHDLSKGFPALTFRKLAFKTMFHELLWILRGDSNIGYLQKNGVKIWDHWSDETGNIGISYPTTWRKLPDYEGGHIDQVANVIEGLKNDPTSRRHVVCAWNPALVGASRLPPCHSFFCFYADDGRLSCHLTQRSGDTPAGVFFNIPLYCLLTHLISHIVGIPVGVFSHTIINAHIYVDQVGGVLELLGRNKKELPGLWVDPNLKNIDEVSIDSAKLTNYHYCEPQIKFPIAV